MRVGMLPTHSVGAADNVEMSIAAKERHPVLSPWRDRLIPNQYSNYRDCCENIPPK